MPGRRDGARSGEDPPAMGHHLLKKALYARSMATLMTPVPNAAATLQRVSGRRARPLRLRVVLHRSTASNARLTTAVSNRALNSSPNPHASVAGSVLVTAAQRKTRAAASVSTIATAAAVADRIDPARRHASANDAAQTSSVTARVANTPARVRLRQRCRPASRSSGLTRPSTSGPPPGERSTKERPPEGGSRLRLVRRDTGTSDPPNRKLSVPATCCSSPSSCSATIVPRRPAPGRAPCSRGSTRTRKRTEGSRRHVLHGGTIDALTVDVGDAARPGEGPRVAVVDGNPRVSSFNRVRTGEGRIERRKQPPGRDTIARGRLDEIGEPGDSRRQGLQRGRSRVETLVQFALDAEYASSSVAPNCMRSTPRPTRAASSATAMPNPRVRRSCPRLL